MPKKDKKSGVAWLEVHIICLRNMPIQWLALLKFMHRM